VEEASILLDALRLAAADGPDGRAELALAGAHDGLLDALFAASGARDDTQTSNVALQSLVPRAVAEVLRAGAAALASLGPSRLAARLLAARGDALLDALLRTIEQGVEAATYLNAVDAAVCAALAVVRLAVQAPRTRTLLAAPRTSEVLARALAAPSASNPRAAAAFARALFLAVRELAAVAWLAERGAPSSAGGERAADALRAAAEAAVGRFGLCHGASPLARAFARATLSEILFVDARMASVLPPGPSDADAPWAPRAGALVGGALARALLAPHALRYLPADAESAGAVPIEGGDDVRFFETDEIADAAALRAPSALCFVRALLAHPATAPGMSRDVLPAYFEAALAPGAASRGA
jgi:hypothetical protein